MERAHSVASRSSERAHKAQFAGLASCTPTPYTSFTYIDLGSNQPKVHLILEYVFYPLQRRLYVFYRTVQVV